MESDIFPLYRPHAPGSIVGEVLIGHRSQLFLARGAHDILAMATGERQIPKDSFQSFRNNIQTRHARATSIGASYVHVLFPDKQSVLRDDYITASPICLGERHLAQSPEIAPHVFYPLQLLRDEGRSSFLTTDTHLSDRGTITTICALVARLTGSDQSAARDRLLASLTVTRTIVGDLGSKLDPPHSSVEAFAEPWWCAHWLHNGLQGGNNGIVDLYFNPRAVFPGRVLWFGDSFGREAVRFLSYFFEEVFMLRTPFFHSELFDCIRPTILVTENVERYLADCPSDIDRPSFFMFPHVAGLTYAPSKEFAVAFSAVLSAERPPYMTFTAELHERDQVEHQTLQALHGLDAVTPDAPITSDKSSISADTAVEVAASYSEAERFVGVSVENELLAQRHGVPSHIHPEDLIYQFVLQQHSGDVNLAVANYIELGRYSASMAEEMLLEVGRIKSIVKAVWTPTHVMDFASGFGCVARHLRRTLAGSKLTACDIHHAAVRFNQDVLGVESFLSTAMPESLNLPPQDAIFAMSFFSHLPKATFGRWLQALCRHLNPGGVLIFTANGRATDTLGITGTVLDDDGFGFRPESEQTDLEGSDYGITVSYPRWVLRTLATDVPNVHLAYFREAHWWAVQDTYICVRQ